MSYVGQPLVCPRGFRGLQSGRVYHYLGRSDNQQTVVLCFFSESPVRVYIERMAADQFEAGVLEGLIAPKKTASPYPPWIAPHVDQASNDQTNASSLARILDNNLSTVRKRLDHIRPLVDMYREVLSADDPCRIVNSHARACKPKQHSSRVRLWFFSYICFGMSDHALLPDTWKNGRWNRDEQASTKKLGRKNKATGEFSGHRGTPELTELCITGYNKYKNQPTFYKTWLATVINTFGCHFRIVDGKREIYHPENKPFPSYHQFMRRVYKKYGRKRVRTARYGAARQRRKEHASTGKFTASVSSLMERIEADGYYVSSTLKGLNGEPAPPMCVVRIIDVTSGLRVGIGCSLNGEKAEAYKMALFCMGIPKQVFCSYFGISISPKDWPSVGYPLSYVLDRGPGTKASLWELLSKMVPHIEMTPAGSGQSKASVESTNPRKTRKEGRVKHRISNLNYFDYFKNEILQTIAENKTSDISGRQTLESIKDHVKPRPIHLWNYLDRRLRNDAVVYDFQTVAESFLEKQQYKVSRSGVHLDILRFTSDALRETNLCSRITGEAALTVDGFILPMTIRQIWIKFDGRLIESHLTHALLGDHSGLDCTVNDLAQIIAIRKNLETEARAEDDAIAVEIAEKFKEATGQSPFGGTIQSRRPRRKTREAMDELAAIQKLFGRKYANGN